MDNVKRALIFPGMSLQSVGIGRDLYAAYPEAREVFEEVDDILEFKLSDLMFSGDPALFNLMEHKRPGLITVSVATARVLEKQTDGHIWDSVDCVAGHSFGEWAALCVAGSLNFYDTVRLIRDNAREMHNDPILQKGKMLALIRRDLTEDEAQAIADEAAEDQVCVVANNNGPGQIVLSGHSDAIDRAERIARSQGFRVCQILNEGTPAHSPLMQHSAGDICARLEQIEIRPPRVPLISNQGRVLWHPKSIRREVPGHIASKVLWNDAVHAACQRGVEEFLELGPSPALLAGMIKHMDCKTRVVPLHGPEAIEDFVHRLQSFSAAPVVQYG